jgi:DNA-binding transcriptional LysR family regulator
MVDLWKRVPRPSALLMFEAAARHLSFTLAARELLVTQAAVSQQVRSLEQALGIALFERRHRGLGLTKEGTRLHRSVAMALEHIASTTDDLRAIGAAEDATIGVTLALATFWLVSRLPQFRALHPEIDIRVVATDRGIEKIIEQVDAAIAWGNPPWPGFSASLLRQGEAFPVCSPEYLSGRPGLASVEQLLDETLLFIDDDRPGHADWPIFFAEHGIKLRASSRHISMNSLPLVLQAACEGQGIALGYGLLTDDLLARGSLIRPVAARIKTTRSYYFLLSHTKSSRHVIAFRDWLLEHFEQAPGGDRPPLTVTALTRPRERVERVAQPIAEHVEAKHRQKHHAGRRKDIPRRQLEILKADLNHRAPGRGRRLRPQPDEA